MARKKTTDLDEFKEYLAEKHIGATTARVYAAHCRRILSEVSPLTTADLTMFLYERITAESRSTVRAAWNHFRSYSEACLDKALPEAGHISIKTARDAFQEFMPSPPLLQTLLMLLHDHRVPASLLAEACWRHVQIDRREGRRVCLHIPESHQSGSLFPVTLLPALCAWADPETGKPKLAQPFIPMQTGGTRPVTASVLRKLALKYGDPETARQKLDAIFPAEPEADAARFEFVPPPDEPVLLPGVQTEVPSAFVTPVLTPARQTAPIGGSLTPTEEAVLFAPPPLVSRRPDETG